MKFTIQEETNNTIHFRDVTITRTKDTLTFDIYIYIYRNPTTTDTIIPKHWCHSLELKSTAINFLTNRPDTYILNDDSKTKENNIIKHILHNNKYDNAILHKPPKTHKGHKLPAHTTKCATFT
jgi:hypothetical protein